MSNLDPITSHSHHEDSGHVISRSSVVILITNCYIRFTYLLTYSANTALTKVIRWNSHLYSKRCLQNTVDESLPNWIVDESVELVSPVTVV